LDAAAQPLTLAVRARPAPLGAANSDGRWWPLYGLL